MTKVFIASNKMNEICEKAVAKWGEQAQIAMLVEECGELLQALMHHFRGRNKIEDVQTEIADVLMMCWQMRHIFGENGVDEQLKYKLARIEKRGLSKKDV